MTAPLELVECTHCQSFFAAASSEEVFCHATKRCRREKVASPNDYRRDTSTPPRRAIIRG
ncbi:MAG TPA: hypothetical protein VJZ00_21635 [Thermoanaerobaculia bacterium]|nr:hypothetical protein [Thermoanaerobaculia bacterium]